MISAAERVLTASQQLVVDRLDLLILEAKDGVTRALEAAVIAGVAVGVFFCAWLCINAALAVFFRPTASLSGILAVLAVVNLGVGALAIASARQLAAPKRHTENGRAGSQRS
jgi:uncharacterized membrane protein YqjE